MRATATLRSTLLMALLVLIYDAAAETHRLQIDKRAYRDQGITPVGGKTRDLSFAHTARRDVHGTPDLLSIETVKVLFIGGIGRNQRFAIHHGVVTLFEHDAQGGDLLVRDAA